MLCDPHKSRIHTSQLEFEQWEKYKSPLQDPLLVFFFRLEEVLAMGLRTDVGITHQVRGLSYLVRVIVSHSLVYTHTHTHPPIPLALAAIGRALV